MSDLISRQAAIDAVKKHYRTHDNDLLELIAFDIERLPPAQGKPFNLPEIYIADGYDTIESEDGNVGFGVYVPDENQIYVAGDVEGEIRARALLHEICHWVQAMCGRPFDEDEANEFSDIVYDALPSAQAERTCVNCGRTVNNGGWYADGRTRCPIEEHYALPKDGYCHLWEKRSVTDDDMNPCELCEEYGGHNCKCCNLGNPCIGCADYDMWNDTCTSDGACGDFNKGGSDEARMQNNE